jgi:hypothetical protein
LRCDRFSGSEIEAADERAQCRERMTRAVVQQVGAPRQRVTQRSLPRRQVACTSCDRDHIGTESSKQLLRCQRPSMRRG